jgi:NAD(P)-dependent dehydrogenase (short-subunit alcohol dehydrogenase family)
MVDSPRTLASDLDLGSADQIPVRVNSVWPAQNGRATVTHLIDRRGLAPTAAGLAFLPFTLGVGLLSRLFGGLADRIGARAMRRATGSSRLMPQERQAADPKRGIPLRRYGEHIELANLCGYLVSDQAAYITGECVVIDGGKRYLAGSSDAGMLDWTDEF